LGDGMVAASGRTPKRTWGGRIYPVRRAAARVMRSPGGGVGGRRAGRGRIFSAAPG
jgi:hypothetical protein